MGTLEQDGGRRCDCGHLYAAHFATSSSEKYGACSSCTCPLFRERDKLDWQLEIDDNDDPYLFAASRYHDEGSLFEHRIKQIGQKWHCFCTDEILTAFTEFESLREAMLCCEEVENE